MADSDLAADSDSAGTCLDFRVPAANRRLWSPHLSVQLSPIDEEVEIFGRYSPRPEVWTFVMLLYFAATFVAIGGAIYGCVQIMLNAVPWAMVAMPLGAAVIFGLHVASVAGQRLSADQMESLRDRFDLALKRASELE